jgi:hypothetical protein
METKLETERSRSRSYPVVDLEAAAELLARLGPVETEEVDRKALAKLLGYTTGSGGVAARKVGALVQYGLIDRHAGSYRLSLRGSRLRRPNLPPADYRLAIQGALEQPPLFRWILDRYQREGRIPENLDRILTRDYGITARASEEAANVFLRSARFAGVLSSDGLLIDPKGSAAAETGRPSDGPLSVAPDSPDTWKGRLDLHLTNRRSAWLVFPSIMTDEDLTILEERLRFELEHQGLRKFVTVNPRSADGNVIPVGFGSRAKRPKS